MDAKPLNIHQRLHAAMGEVDYVQRERRQGMNYSIVSHDAVTAKVRPVLHKVGIVYYPVSMTHQQNGTRTEVCLTVRFANIDDPADYIDVPGLGYGVDPQDKGPGKAVSYAVKYCLLKALGLETGDDPDQDDVKPEPARKAPPPAAEKQKTAAKQDNAKASGAPPQEWPLFDPKGHQIWKTTDGKAYLKRLDQELGLEGTDPRQWWHENKAVAHGAAAAGDDEDRLAYNRMLKSVKDYGLAGAA